MPIVSPSGAVMFETHGSRFHSYVAPSRGSDQLCAWRLEIPPGLEGVAHRPTRDEVLLVLDGDLRISLDGLSDDPLDDWNGSGDAGFLASLAYETPEDLLVAHDAGCFPDWDALPGGRPDWIDFTNGKSHIRIGNVNHTKLENVLGVDLVYRHIEADTTVLVQYKRMRQDGKGDWFYRPDTQLAKELVRMRKVDSRPSASDSPRTWRLHPRGCLLKLVRQPKEFDPQSDRLLPSLYLPLEYRDRRVARRRQHPDG